MDYPLIEKLKLQTGDVVDRLTVRESMKVKDVIGAQANAKTNGTLDAERFTAELIARMAGIAYEDVLEMDIRDYDALDGRLADIRFPKVDAVPSGSTQSKGSKTSP